MAYQILCISHVFYGFFLFKSPIPPELECSTSTGCFIKQNYNKRTADAKVGEIILEKCGQLCRNIFPRVFCIPQSTLSRLIRIKWWSERTCGKKSQKWKWKALKKVSQYVLICSTILISHQSITEKKKNFGKAQLEQLHKLHAHIKEPSLYV